MLQGGKECVCQGPVSLQGWGAGHGAARLLDVCPEEPLQGLCIRVCSRQGAKEENKHKPEDWLQVRAAAS